MLEQIHGLSDLKKLDIKQLPDLCEEIRAKLVATVEENGGHLASNLGVVELTVALHYVFDVSDKIVWDVGHQSYVHKLLTGRAQEFDTLRTVDGLSGFPDTEESESDAFNTGHAGTSISAALGLAKARDLSGEKHDVIAVVGDGALTDGLSYEGLNNICGTKMFIVLNDNNMAIDKNVGSAAKNLSKVRVGKGYLRFKRNTKKFLNALPLIGRPLLRLCKKIVRNVRLSKLHNIYFENFDIRYIGPVNGHDIKDLVFYLSKIKTNVDKPTVLHVITQKGHGYQAAAENPLMYHAVQPKKRIVSTNMSQIVGDTLVDMAKSDEKIVAITAAMAHGTGLASFFNEYPKRSFDVGIAEEHAVTFAAGLAKGGYKPYVAIYSTFLQRAFDQILHDVCLQKLPVTFLIDRGGFVGEDGQTHQGLFDISFLRSVPDIVLLAPSDNGQLKQMIKWSQSYNAPVAIRYPKSYLEHTPCDFSFGKWNVFGKTDSIAVIFAVGGNCLAEAFSAQKILSKKGVDCAVVNACCIKPLDVYTLFLMLKNAKIAITAEEGMLNGGFGSAVNDFCLKNELAAKIINVGVDDHTVKHADFLRQLKDNGIDGKKFADLIDKYLSV